MKNIIPAFLTIFLVAFAFNVQAETKKETAESLVKSAIAHYKAVGQDTAFGDFAHRGGEYNHGEFYLFIQALDSADMVFHGVNPKLVGKNLLKLKDTDGNLFVQRLYDNAKKDGKGWVDYKWPHPETKKITPKVVYSEVHNDLIFSTGYYN